MLRMLQSSTRSVTTLRQFCTDLKTLPAIHQLLDKLPTTVHAEATKLSRAIDKARSAIEVATEDDSDSIDRKDALAQTRYALILYKRLAERVAPFPSTLPNGLPHLNFVSEYKEDDGTAPGTDSSLVTMQSPPPEQQTPSEKKEGFYPVPSAKDAYAPELADTSNAVVRVFGPHMADLRHSVYLSHRQRVWIGWRGWF